MNSVIHVHPDQECPMSDRTLPGPVVVGIDGSDAAIGAAEWAAKEAVHYGVPLRLVYVIQITDDPVAAADAYPAEENCAENSLRAARSAVEATGLPVDIDTAVRCEDVDSALIAESKTATLVCVGCAGIGRVANAVLGSTATTLAGYAHCPVAIIRRLADGPLPESGFIAVVVDDQPDNAKVMQWAMEEARVRRAPVLALRTGRCWGHFEIGDEQFCRRLDGWLRRYPDITVEVASTRLSLARYLEGYLGAVQLVVIGTEDAHRVPQLVGPVGLPIFVHADCSVLVVRGN
jgi:nucleotide-binding universal stress UspA family protein